MGQNRGREDNLKMTELMRKTTISLFLLLSVTAQALTPSDTAISVTPNAASLGEYGTVPVSLFTGCPQIQIPLYTIDHHGFSIPLFLSYHSSGVRPEQHPGWVGTGWTLMAGGMVSRRIKHKEDDLYWYETAKGYYYCHGDLAASDWGTKAFTDRFACNEKYFCDGEPDEFSFTANGLSGSFCLGEDGAWHVKCDHDVSVSVTFSSGNHPLLPYKKGDTAMGDDRVLPRHFYRFELTSDDGTRYIFGGSPTSIEYSIDFWNQYGDRWKAVTWMLTSVILPTGEEISLSYSRGSLIAEMGVNLHTSRYSFEENGEISPEILAENLQGSLLSPVYLSSITTPGVSATFHHGLSQQLGYDKAVFLSYRNRVYGEGGNPRLPYLKTDATPIGNFQLLDTLRWRQLDSIRIRERHGSSSSVGVTLSYSTSGRLTLNGVSVGPKHYSMEYNNMAGLPPYLSCRTDHWGYYTSPSFALYPRINPGDTFAAHLPNMEANPDSMALGILTRITYPTGGYTRFEYEPHTFSKIHDRGNVISQSGVAGGLRVRRVIDGTGGSGSVETVAHEYFYTDTIPQGGGDNYASSGVLRFLPRYSYQLILYEVGCSIINAMRYHAQTVTPASNNYTGRHIGYTRVIDRLPDGSYTLFRFSNFDTAGGLDTPSEFCRQYRVTGVTDPVSDREEDRGLLMEESEYTAQGTLMRRVTNTYSPDSYGASVRSLSNLRYDRAEVLGLPPSPSDCSYYDIDCYRVFTYTNRLTGRIVREYDSTGSFLARVYNYHYNSHHQLSSESCISPDHTLSVTYEHVTDRDSAVYAQMAQRHIYSPVVSAVRTVTYPDDYTETLSAVYTHYGQFHSTPSPLFAPCQVDAVTGNGQIRPVMYYESYDKSGNLTSMRTAEGDRTVFVWGYGGRCLLATVVNATRSQVEAVLGSLDTFSSQATPGYALLETLRSSLPSAQVTTYHHDPLFGPVSMTDPAGLTTYYRYDLFGRLSQIHDHHLNLIQSYAYKYHDLNDIPH